MRIENISSKIQYYTHIIPYKKGHINFKVGKREVTFKYLSKTYRIECNPLMVEDAIKDYIEKEKL
jgi:hypothetical protein